MRLGDGEAFQNYFRLSRDQFDGVLAVVGPTITRQDTTYRRAISPAERLSICLRYLATGDSYQSLAYQFRVGVTTVSCIVPDVAKAIWDGFVDKYMAMPQEEEWMAIAQEFEERWQFPNCIGAIDGKHVTIQAPPNSGSMFYNYKGTYSIVLLAVVDANYCFRMVDVGAYGKGSDGGTLKASAFGRALQARTLHIPPDKHLPGAPQLGEVPHVFVGDEAFPLQRHIMRPYPGQDLSRQQHHYNYRLSRARMVVECAFGILASRFRIYSRVMGQHPHNVEACVKATCILHNLLRSTEAQPPSLDHTTPMARAGRQGANNSTREVMQLRETFATYFSSEAGELPQQHARV
ncbi:uncharacterized protein ACN63O_020368 [Diretmus argenteus]